MQQFRLIVSAVTLGALFLSSSVCAKKDDFPEITEDGLHRVQDSKMALVYAEPEADLSIYEHVILLDAHVAFKKNWARDQRTKSAQPLRINSKDIENIKNSLAEQFNEVFRETLEEGGYTLTDTPAENALLIRPAIINLDVNAPDTPSAGRSYSFTSSAGEMTLYLELYDSVTGDLIAKSLDRRMDNAHNGFYTWTNSVSNRQAAQRILKGWANILLTALDEARK